MILTAGTHSAPAVGATASSPPRLVDTHEPTSSVNALVLAASTSASRSLGTAGRVDRPEVRQRPLGARRVDRGGAAPRPRATPPEAHLHLRAGRLPE
jgi:hypothetical protein